MAEQEYHCTTCGERLVWGRTLETDQIPTAGIWRHEIEPEDEHPATVPWADE